MTFMRETSEEDAQNVCRSDGLPRGQLVIFAGSAYETWSYAPFTHAIRAVLLGTSSWGQNVFVCISVAYKM
jgi:hypothetical protein